MLCLFFVVGVAVTALGLRLFVKARAFAGRAQRTVGRIVDGSTQLTQVDMQTASYALVEYTTADGKTVRFERRLSAFPGALGIGKEVKVLYDPAAPDEAVVENLIELYGPALIFGAVGALWTIGSAIAWLLSSAGVITLNP